MATGDKRINIFTDRLLSRTAIKEHFLEYLEGKIDESLTAIMQGLAGTLDTDKIGLLADGTDKFKLDVSQANRVVVGSGAVITVPASIVDATSKVDFENATGVPYYVGIRHALIEVDPQLNPRKGTPEYAAVEDTFGEVGYPDASPVPVDTPGVNLRLYINSITEVSADNSGRECRVWLVSPVSSVESVAFFTGTTGYDGTNNYIDIPYSGGAGPLGQDTSSDPPSLVNTDYRVFIKGCSAKTVDIRADSSYAYIGLINGNGPSAIPNSFDTTDQKAVFLFDLDKAYDGIGSGAGRVVTLDAGPIEARVPAAGPGGSDDPFNAGFLCDALDDLSTDHTIPLVGIMKPRSGVEDSGGLLIAKVLTDPTGGPNLLAQNNCTIFSASQVQNNGTQDWVAAKVQKGDYAWLQGFATANGLYEVSNQSSLHLSLVALNGTALSLNISEAGQVTVLRPALSVNDQAWGAGNGHNRNVVIRGTNTVGAAGQALQIRGHEQDALAVVNDDGTVTYFRVKQDGKVNIPEIDGNVTLSGEIDHTATTQLTNARMRSLECTLIDKTSRRPALSIHPMGTELAQDGRWLSMLTNRRLIDPTLDTHLETIDVVDMWGLQNRGVGQHHQLWVGGGPANESTDYTPDEFSLAMHPWTWSTLLTPNVRPAGGYFGRQGILLRAIDASNSFSANYGLGNTTGGPNPWRADDLAMFRFVFYVEAANDLAKSRIEFGLSSDLSPFRNVYIRFDAGSINNDIRLQYFDGAGFYAQTIKATGHVSATLYYGTIGILSHAGPPTFYYEVYEGAVLLGRGSKQFAGSVDFGGGEPVTAYIYTSAPGGAGAKGFVMHETATSCGDAPMFVPAPELPVMPRFLTL